MQTIGTASLCTGFNVAKRVLIFVQSACMNPLGDGLTEELLDGSIALGQDVVYCGFPLGMEMGNLPGANNWPTPLIKSAMFSGLIHHAGVVELLFDTVNNPGFSGGPIIKRDQAGLRVVGIVSGYRFDAPIPVCQRDEHGMLAETADYFVRPNSGFMIGLNISRGIELAKAIV